MDDSNGHQQVQQQLCQLFWLIDAAAHVVQVHGKGQDKADLCQLCGLKGKAAQFIPGVVVGITGVVADGQRPMDTLRMTSVGSTRPHVSTTCTGHTFTRLR